MVRVKNLKTAHQTDVTAHLWIDGQLLRRKPVHGSLDIDGTRADALTVRPFVFTSITLTGKASNALRPFLSELSLSAIKMTIVLWKRVMQMQTTLEPFVSRFIVLVAINLFPAHTLLVLNLRGWTTNLYMRSQRRREAIE